MKLFSCRLMDDVDDEECSELIYKIYIYNSKKYKLKRHLAHIKKLIMQYPAMLNRKSDHGWTPLMVACYFAERQQTTKFVKLLLKQDIDIYSEHTGHMNAIQLACSLSGNISIKIIKLFIKIKNYDINAQTTEGRTLLMYAVETLNIYTAETLVEFLLSIKNIDVNKRIIIARDEQHVKGETALIKLFMSSYASNKSINIVKLLLNKKIEDPDDLIVILKNVYLSERYRHSELSKFYEKAFNLIVSHPKFDINSVHGDIKFYRKYIKLYKNKIAVARKYVDIQLIILNNKI